MGEACHWHEGAEDLNQCAEVHLLEVVNRESRANGGSLAHAVRLIDGHGVPLELLVDLLG